MHKLAIAQETVKIVQEYAQRERVKKVVCVYLCIGKLSGILPEALDFCLSICKTGTSLESVDFKIECVPAIAKCKDCFTYFDITMHDFSCPCCNHSNWEIISGKELSIKYIEVI